MRIPPGLLGFSAGVALVFQSPAQQPAETRMYKVGDFRFALPADWKSEAASPSVTTGVVFKADGAGGSRFTLARLANPPPKLDAIMDPMTSVETSDLRISLEEAGLKPITGSLNVTVLGETTIESVSYRCRASQGQEQQVLMSTMRNSQEILRARLQVTAANSDPLVQGVLASWNYRGKQTSSVARLQPGGVGASVTVANTSAGAAGVVPAVSTPRAPAPLSGGDKVSTAGDVGRIVQESRGSLVFVEGGGGAGSGFVCRMREGMFLLTNQHVVAGMKTPNFTRLDSLPITPGAGFAAIGHDLMRFGLQAESNPLIAMYDIEKEVKIGDDIVVLGNSEGARVIQPLEGKLIGIGPDRIEVTAQFVPGNSGSPIVHVPTGKVIGIATYLIQGRFPELSDSREKKVRRFGYRLDSVKQWQPLNWQAFQQDKTTMDRVEGSSRDLFRLIKDMQADKWPSAADYTNSTLSRAVRDLDTLASRQGVSKADRSRAFSGFFASVRAVTRADVLQARQTLRYDFFQRSLNEETQVREEMFRLFDRLVKAR